MNPVSTYTGPPPESYHDRVRREAAEGPKAIARVAVLERENAALRTALEAAHTEIEFLKAPKRRKPHSHEADPAGGEG